jgi:biopolymer transport protein ExbD
MKLRSPLPVKKNRLEIIPLIDIMFFLLASFMLVSLTMSRQQTIKVNLPTATAVANDFKPDKINLAVDASGLLFLDQQRITLPELEAALTARHRQAADTPVYISGDKASSHGDMMTLLDTVRRAGFQKVAFQTSPPAAK